MKIELNEAITPHDALEQVISISSYHRHTLSQITSSADGMEPNDAYGLILIFELQEALIKAAMAKQDAIHATKLEAVEA